jgi:uncharacterized protein
MRREPEWLATTSPIEYRSAVAGKPAVIQGYASVFNSPSQPIGHQGVVETVAPTFHNKQKGDNNFRNVIAKYDHRSDFLLGSVDAGSLELEIRSGGLWYAVHINPETRSGADVYQWVRSKIVTGSSFGFIAFDDSWGWKNGHPERTLLSGKTMDVGPTSTPAYEASSASALRSLAAHVEADYDTVLADAQTGQLSRYFIRTDQQVPPVTVSPAAELVEARGVAPSSDGGLDIMRRRLQLRRRMMDAELTPKQRAAQEIRERMADITTRRARLRLSETRIENQAEARSFDSPYLANSGPAGRP